MTKLEMTIRVTIQRKKEDVAKAKAFYLENFTTSKKKKLDELERLWDQAEAQVNILEYVLQESGFEI